MITFAIKFERNVNFELHIKKTQPPKSYLISFLICRSGITTKLELQFGNYFFESHCENTVEVNFLSSCVHT